MCIYCITPLAKGLCDTPLVLLTLEFHDLHPFLIYTPTPSVYAHPIFNCVFWMEDKLVVKLLLWRVALLIFGTKHLKYEEYVS